MNEQENLEITLAASVQSTVKTPTTSTSPSLKSPESVNGPGTSPSTQSTPTKGSLEWLKAKRESWKASQRHTLVEYPSSEGNEIQKAQQALDLLCAIQTGNTDVSAILSKTNNTDQLQSDATQSDESTTREIYNRDRLIAFYEKYNPSKVSTVDETLQKYRGQEDEMFRKLEAKYAKDPYLPATGTGPKCFMEFSTGDRVTFELFQDKVPFATENFRSLCTGETGVSYRNCVVHRIVPNFCIQAGDYTKGDGTGGRSIFPKASPANPKTDMWGNFEDETSFLRHDSPGLLSMANNGPNRNSSQFFITLRPLPHLNGKHVVFGRVTQGMEIVEKLSRLETNSKTQRPIESLRIVDCGELNVDEMDASTKQQPVFTASNTSTPSAFPSFSMFPLNARDTGIGLKQEEKTIDSNDNIKFEHPATDDLNSSNRDSNLCFQINSCLPHLQPTVTSDIPASSQGVAQNMEKDRHQSSLPPPRKDSAVQSRLEPFFSNPVKPKSLNIRGSKPTLATLLLEDPLGLSFMDMAKGNEKALMKPIPQLHSGAVTLKCVQRSAPKKLNILSVMLEGASSTGQYHPRCDPLAISFSMYARHDQT